jgi:hypothetical protein
MLVQPTVIYVIWRTISEDNIGTVLINRYNRLMPPAARIISEF